MSDFWTAHTQSVHQWQRLRLAPSSLADSGDLFGALSMAFTSQSGMLVRTRQARETGVRACGKRIGPVGSTPTAPTAQAQLETLPQPQLAASL